MCWTKKFSYPIKCTLPYKYYNVNDGTRNVVKVLIYVSTQLKQFLTRNACEFSLRVEMFFLLFFFLLHFLLLTLTIHDQHKFYGLEIGFFFYAWILFSFTKWLLLTQNRWHECERKQKKNCYNKEAIIVIYIE